MGAAVTAREAIIVHAGNRAPVIDIDPGESHLATDLMVVEAEDGNGDELACVPCLDEFDE